MRTVHAIPGWAVLTAMLLAGCGSSTPPPPPGVRDAGASSQPPPRLIVLHNLQRVLDPQLDVAARVESLAVVRQGGALERSELDRLTALSNEGDCPAPLRQALQAWLREGPRTLQAATFDPYAYPQPTRAPQTTTRAPAPVPTPAPARPTGPVIRAGAGPRLPSAEGQAAAPSREATARPAGPGQLELLVQEWASVDPPQSAHDVRCRQALQTLTGARWDQALLEALNQPGFGAPGAAISILARQLEGGRLTSQLMQLPVRSPAMAALQGYLRLFNYLPTTAKDYDRAAWLFGHQGDGLAGAAELASIWERNYGYRFDVRDTSLLVALATSRGGWARKTRGDLRSELASSLAMRQHVPQELSRQFAGADPSMRLDLVVERLSMADLWNLRLLEAMLQRPAVRGGLGEMSRRDQADRSTAMGGLVFFADNQAEARLYPPEQTSAAGDTSYLPSQQAAEDEPSALCRFWGHFESVDNAHRVGPDQAELNQSRTGNFYGLIITTTGQGRFCAHYLSPTGVVVSLGQFYFGAGQAVEPLGGTYDPQD